MANVLQDVATYQRAGLALLLNSAPEIKLANKMFKEFNKMKANLGSTVTFDLPPSVDYNASIAFGTFGSASQYVQSLTVDKEGSTPVSFTDQEYIFNVEDYMKEFGKASVATLATYVGSDVAQNNIDHTYRAYGDGVTDITSYGQLAQAVANFKNIGIAMTDEMCGIIPDVAAPAIVNNGLNQFAVNRNNEIANSWELGNFSRVNWYTSNLLPTHVAGTAGQAADTLTVVSINAAGDQITLSGVTTDAGAIKSGDILTFQDGVSGQPNMRYLTRYGKVATKQPVQVRATADADATTGTVVVSIYPALVSDTSSRDQNINNAVAAGMELKALPNHTAGVLFWKRALMLAMPELPPTKPYESAQAADPNTGAAMRLYHGHILGQASSGWVHDAIWATTLVDQYAMRLVFVE